MLKRAAEAAASTRGAAQTPAPPAASKPAVCSSCRRLGDFIFTPPSTATLVQRPLELALVRGTTRGTAGAAGRFACGIWMGCPVFASRPRNELPPLLPLLMMSLLSVFAECDVHRT